jgi:hypothetical protein
LAGQRLEIVKLVYRAVHTLFSSEERFVGGAVYCWQLIFADSVVNGFNGDSTLLYVILGLD